MNLLDENIPLEQFELLRLRGIRCRLIGQDIAKLSIGDDNIVPTAPLARLRLKPNPDPSGLKPKVAPELRIGAAIEAVMSLLRAWLNPSGRLGGAARLENFPRAPLERSGREFPDE